MKTGKDQQHLSYTPFYSVILYRWDSWKQGGIL